MILRQWIVSGMKRREKTAEIERIIIKKIPKEYMASFYESTEHNCEKEMTAFIADILPKTNLILVIRIPEKICLNSFHQKLTIW